MHSTPSNTGRSTEKLSGWSEGELELGSAEIQIQQAQAQVCREDIMNQDVDMN